MCKSHPKQKTSKAKAVSSKLKKPISKAKNKEETKVKFTRPGKVDFTE